MSDEIREENERSEDSADQAERVLVETDQVRGVDLLMPAAEGDDLLATLEGAGLELSEDLEADAAAQPSPPRPPAADEGVSRAERARRPWQADRDFFVAEAKAHTGRQPERAALMYLEAVRAGERAAVGLDVVLEDLDAALELQPDSTWLLPRARRSAMRLRSYERALKIGRHEVDLESESHRGAAVMVEAAAVARHYVGKAGAALHLVNRALKIKPGHVPALARAAALCAELKQHEKATEALESLGGAVTAAKQRSLCLYGAGTLRETMLEDEEGARDAYVRAVEADPQNAVALQALAELYAQLEQWPLYCRTLDHLADLIEDPTVRACLLLVAGTVQLERNKDADAAIRALERAAREAPEQEVALAEAALARVVAAFEAKGRHREAVEVLRQRTDPRFGRDDAERAVMLSRVGEQLRADIGDEERALAAFHEALELAPGHVPARQALERIYRRNGDFPKLAEITDPDQGALPDGARAARYFELGRLKEHRLGDPDGATAAHLRALEIDGGLQLAYWEASRLLRDAGRHDERVELLGKQADVSSDARTRVRLQLERARAEAGPLEAPDRAAEALLALDRSVELRSVAFDLVDLCERTGRDDDLVTLLLEQAEVTSDAAEAEAARIRAALVLDARLDDGERATAVLREVIERDPLNYAAVQSLSRILERQEAHGDLVKLLHGQLGKEPDRPDAAWLLCRMGRILAAELGNRGAAVSAYLKAIRTDPGCSQAMLALLSLAPAEERFDDLVKAIEAHAPALGDDRARAAALARAGEIACWRLDDLDRAQGVYEQGVSLHGPAVWPGLLRVRLRQRDYASASAVLEQMAAEAEGDVARAMFKLQLARLKEYRLGEPPDLQLYQQAAEGPCGDRLREELIRVHRLTVDSAEGRGEMADRLVALGRETIDETLAAAYMLEAAHTLEFGEGSGGTGGSEKLLEAATLAYKAEPHDFANIWCLERQLLRQGMWAELAELAEREAKLELDRRVRVQRLTSAADAYLRGGLREDVQRVCQECLNFDAHCLPALLLLAQVAEESEQWRRLAELCDRLAEASADRDSRLAFCLRAAELWSERVEDGSRALASLAVALADAPGHGPAFELAERLLRGRGEVEELSRLYQRRIRACAEESEQVELLRAHAHLLRDEGGRVDRALAALTELIRLAPGDVAALTEIADLHEQQGHWSDAAAALVSLAQGAEDVGERHRALLRQARILVRHLHEVKRARRVLETLLEEQPGDVEALRLLAEVGLDRGDWLQVRPLLEGVAEGTKSVEERVWALLKLAEVVRSSAQRGDDADDGGADAREYLARAVRAADEDADGREELRAQIIGARAPGRLLTEVEEVLGDEASRELGELIAGVCVELGERPRAILHLRRLLGASPDRELSLTLARLLEREHDYPEALTRYRLLLEEDAGAFEAYSGVSRTGTPHIACAAASVVETLGDADAEQREMLAACAGHQPSGRFEADALSLGDVVDAGRAETLESLLRTSAPFISEQLFGASPGGEPLGAGDPVSAAAKAMASTLGLPPPEVARVEGDPHQVALRGEESAPRLLVPRELTAAGAEPRMRFWVARALFFARHAGPAAPELSGAQVEELVAALGEPKPRGAQAQQLRKALHGRMPRKLRKQLDGLQAGRIGEGTASRYWEALEARATLVALVLARAPGQALVDLAGEAGKDLAALASQPKIASLLREVVSDGWESLCQQVWR